MLEHKSTESKQPVVEQGTLFDKAELERLTVKRTTWEETTVKKSLARMPERNNLITTSSVPVNRVYTPQDNAGLDYTRDLNLPGEYTYTRGVQPTMYRAKPWTMLMFAGFGTAEDTNARFKYLLKQGQTGLSTAFDMATLYGYDTDHPLAMGEFGKCGVAVSSLADMEVLFADLPLDKITTSMTINSPAAAIWAMYIANAEKHGFPMASLGGTLQNDIFKEYIAQKEFLFPPEHAALEHDQYQWLPYPRGGRYRHSGVGLYARRWPGVRRCDAGARPEDRRVRATPLVLLRCTQ